MRRTQLIPHTFEQSGVDLMNARDVFLRLGDEILALVFDHVRIAHANERIVIVESDFRLRPSNDFSLWAVGFDAARRAKPDYDLHRRWCVSSDSCG